MEVSVLPEWKLEGAKERDRLSVRITLHLTASTKGDKKKLQEIWQRLETNDSVDALLLLMRESAGG